MSSFFEKLKRGMNVEGPAEEPIIEEKKTEIASRETPNETETDSKGKQAPCVAGKKPKKTKRRNKAAEFKIKTLETEPRNSEAKVEKEDLYSLPIQTKTLVEEDKSSSSPFAAARVTKDEALKESEEQKKKKWSSFGREEGQLAIDVYQTENELVIQSAIAGVKPENLDISMERDIIIVKGHREKLFEENGDYFTKECFWGPFSREVILPAEVDPGRATAEMKNGILTIRIPKILRQKKRKIAIKER